MISLKAGGTGLNLTSANRVIHFDRWWNPAVEDQATDRAWRIGQQKTVFVHKLVCRGTLEERINQLLIDKKELASQSVGTGDEWFTDMGTDQLREIFFSQFSNGGAGMIKPSSQLGESIMQLISAYTNYKDPLGPGVAIQRKGAVRDFFVQKGSISFEIHDKRERAFDVEIHTTPPSENVRRAALSGDLHEAVPK